MQTKTKALIHYIINTTVLLITVGALVLSPLAYQSNPNPVNTLGVSFVVIFIVMSLSNAITTFVLSNESEKPYRILLPLMLTSLVYALLLGMVVSVYAKFFDGKYHNAITMDLWGSIGMMFFALLVSLAIIVVGTLPTKLILSSMSGNRATEWEINNFESLIHNKAKITHGNSFSYLYSTNKLSIIHFITEDVIERKLLLEDKENESKSEIITLIENEVERISNLIDIPVTGTIVYLSNKLPETEGTNGKLNIIKNNDLFSNFKKFESDKEISFEKIEETIK